MSEIKNQKILMPEYLLNFSCIGSECEDTCCRGWTVVLDKKTYKKYKNNEHTKLKGLLVNSIVRNRKSITDHYYGAIKLDEQGNCPMLDENILCKIHAEAGEDYLSNTCYFYPKNIKKINNVLEMSASVSCPVITRLVLLSPEPMGFVEIEEQIKRPYVLTYVVENTNSFDESKDPMYYFQDLRIFMITLLQDRRYSLDERILLLGLVFKKIPSLQKNNELNKLIGMLNEYQNQFDEVENIKSMFGNHGDDYNIPFSEKFIKQLFSIEVLLNFSNKRYLECVDEIRQGLELDKKDMLLTKTIYLECYKKYYKPYFKEKEYILENYMVNEIFKEAFPFAKMCSIDDSYMMLLNLYNVIKFHLIGISSFYKLLNDDIVLKVIQSFSKVILHHNDYLTLFQVETY